MSKALREDKAKQRPASKIPLPARSHAPLAGAASSHTGKTKVSSSEQDESQKLDSSRSKLERSLDAFIKARKELEEILSAEGSSEQGRLTSGSSAGLQKELRRHRQLTSRAESALKEKNVPKHQSGGAVKKLGSSAFLKPVMD